MLRGIVGALVCNEPQYSCICGSVVELQQMAEFCTTIINSIFEFVVLFHLLAFLFLVFAHNT